MNTVRHIVSLLIFAGACHAHCQNAVHNYGNLQIHETAMVGFHIDVINDGTFDQNLGLVGFYNENNPITVSGAFAPVFYDTEVAITDGLYLQTAVGVNNNLNFILGNMYTPKNRSDIAVRFSEQAFYVGEGNNTKIDGYASAINKATFTFPVGDDDRLRPLTVTSSDIISLSICAYFYENPNIPSTVTQKFDTEKRDKNVMGVSTKEFWKLEGDMPVMASLSWDAWSDINVLSEHLSDLTVVGWSKKEKQWINLGNSDFKGELSKGYISSEIFIPNDYEAITIGGINDMNETLSTVELGNYYLSPNGDGINDYLVLEGINKSPRNLLQIFNRYGVLVYYKENYNNEFEGLSNRKMVINRKSGLDSGVYFYIITLNDLKIKHQGYLYLARAKKK
ncbi:hypothetical protein KCTC52924_02217 [Arenibacter antarcticus]|uniref:Gliding motility-associated C-terminal domain-containing protein n=1 Tax=Arenibacter antarcticus TaxID=2040469 RepID=A0ABW5VCW7_9FLAO|nr:gliding motility-associated C-terminal domain-containing protein [Arenibacter sp. H213]MCM4168637.1 hypothetical protein [Arenibacter sp. H213]